MLTSILVLGFVAKPVLVFVAILAAILLSAIMAPAMADLSTEYGKPGQDELWPYSNTGSAIAAGDVVALVTGSTGMIGIAKGDIAATTGTGTLQTRGLVTMTKATGEAFTVGQVVYWGASGLTGTGTTTIARAGRVVVAAASAATTATIALNHY